MAETPGTDTPDVLLVGETLIDFLPAEPGSLATVETFSRRAGGAAANVAVGLSRLDMVPWFLTNVSTDGFGDFLCRTLEENGVSPEFVARDPVHETTLAFVSHDARGEREFTFHGTDTADGYLDASTVPDDVLEHVSWVCVNAPVALAASESREAIFAICERAREHGCTIAFDPNTRRDRWPDEKTLTRSFRRLFSLTDVCKVSREDLSGPLFTAEREEDLAGEICEAGPHTVFLTRGGAGASVHATERAPWGALSSAHPGYEVTTVDTTGAGDAFLAGAIAALAEGKSVIEALAFANAVAARTTTAAGAIAALPERDAVETLRESD